MCRLSCDLPDLILCRGFKLLPRIEEAWLLGEGGNTINERENLTFLPHARDPSLPAASPPSKSQVSVIVQTTYNPGQERNRRVPFPTDQQNPQLREEWTRQEQAAAQLSAKPQTLEEFKASVRGKRSAFFMANKY